MCDELTFSIFELSERIYSEDAARVYLEQLRWQYGMFCPLCGSEEKQYKLARRGFYRCGECRRSYTVRTGTIFERSHIGLAKWIFAIYFIITARKGMSSIQLSKHLGVNQKTATKPTLAGRKAISTAQRSRELAGAVLGRFQSSA